MNEKQLGTTVADLHPVGMPPPRAVCDECGRPTWQADDGGACGFPQADGVTYCQGALR